MRTEKTWILVADSSAARIYDKASRTSLELLDSLSHPEARARPGDVYADAPGRVQESHGATRHSVTPRTDLHAEEAHRFAREIAQRLDTDHQKKHFGKIVLMAPPAFLGALRGELSKGVASAVVGEVAKNLLAADEPSIIAHIP
jgi:protein required for attachment to host cells